MRYLERGLSFQVRTAPTPSQPPTPYADNEKPLPGQVLREVDEPIDDVKGKEMGTSDPLPAEATEVEKEGDYVDSNLANATEEKCVIADTNANPPDLVSQVPSVHQSQTDGAHSAETDSLADLDIVAVSGEVNPDSPNEIVNSPPGDMTTPPVPIETPPDMPDSPTDIPGSPVISLPDAPSSDPGSPVLQVC